MLIKSTLKIASHKALIRIIANIRIYLKKKEKIADLTISAL